MPEAEHSARNRQFVVPASAGRDGSSPDLAVYSLSSGGSRDYELDTGSAGIAPSSQARPWKCPSRSTR